MGSDVRCHRQHPADHGGRDVACSERVAHLPDAHRRRGGSGRGAHAAHGRNERRGAELPARAADASAASQRRAGRTGREIPSSHLIIDSRRARFMYRSEPYLIVSGKFYLL